MWRNPQARREVVAQALEYAGAVFRMGYDEFERTILKARAAEGDGAKTLFQLAAAADSTLDEAEFVDAVSRNLKRGRAVVAVVGDGIREDIAPLAEVLQSHAGQRFTFALVELGVFEKPESGERLVVPSVLAKTVLIERGVVRLADQRIVVEPVHSEPLGARPSSPARAISIGEDEFYENLGQRDPAAPQLLRHLLEEAEKIGVYADRKAGLSLKHDGAGEKPLNLGTIRKDGYLDTGPASWWGRLEEANAYNATLAQAIGGKVGRMKQDVECALRTGSDKTPRLVDLLPRYEQIWLRAMEAYVTSVVKREGASA